MEGRKGPSPSAGIGPRATTCCTPVPRFGYERKGAGVPAIATGWNCPMRLALFEPDIPQNAGSMLRLAACLGIAVDVIEPCGFVWDDRRLRRAGMDYLEGVAWERHASWPAYMEARLHRPGRLVLLTTKADRIYTGFDFDAADTVLVGRESAGVPEVVHDAVDARIGIPMRPGLRSLNVAVAAAMVLGEALRQTDGFANAPSRP